jgi:hypothetical protein
MPDPTTTRLETAFTPRPGHIVVTGPTADAAALLVARLETEIAASRLVWVNGRGLDAARLRQILAGDGVPAGPLHAVVRHLLAAARHEQRPLVLVVRDADTLDAARLEWLRVTLECAPDAADLVRLVLVGGPALLDTLRRPEARALATRVTNRFSSPPDAVRVRVAPPVRPRRLATSAALGAAVSIGVALLTLWVRDRPAPPTPTPPSTAAAAPAVPAPSEARVAPPPPVATTAPEIAPVPRPVDAPSRTADRPATAPNRATSPARVTSRGTTRLQVGAFRDPANAEALRRTLAARFAHVTVSTVTRGGVTFHRVRLDGFADEAAVQAALAALRRNGLQPIRVRD